MKRSPFATTTQVGDECDKYDYFEATQMDKLLLACKAGRKVFTPEIDRGEDTYPMLKRLYPNINPGHAIQTRRSKFPPRLQNTKELALLYFPSLQRRTKMSTISTRLGCPWGTSTTSSLGKLTASFLRRRKVKDASNSKSAAYPPAEPSF